MRDVDFAPKTRRDVTAFILIGGVVLFIYVQRIICTFTKGKIPIFKGTAVAWWLMPRTPDPEVGGLSPTRVKPCCVLEQGTFTPKKYW